MVSSARDLITSQSLCGACGLWLLYVGPHWLLYVWPHWPLYAWPHWLLYVWPHWLLYLLCWLYSPRLQALVYDILPPRRKVPESDARRVSKSICALLV